MSYGLFLSHTGSDGPLAKAIRKNINNAFEGAVEVFLAQDDIAVGARWKDDILDNLRKSTGIISLFTKQSIGKPWLLIEWSAFWLNEPDKDIFILTGEEVTPENLVSPMVDRQAGVITNPDHLRQLIRTLSQKAGVDKIPFAIVPCLLKDITEALRVQSEVEFSKYQDDLSDLPVDDIEKTKVVVHFLDLGNLNLAGRILDRITLDYLKVNIALNLVASSRIAEAQAVTKHIRSARSIGEVVISLISQEHEDVRIFNELLDQIGYRDETEFTQICVELSRVGKEETELFTTVAGRMNNMAELRKVAMHLIDAGKHEKSIFLSILKRFADRNRAELRKVGEHLLHSGRPCNMQLGAILDILREYNKDQFKMLAAKAEAVWPEFMQEYMAAVGEPQN
jgi:hypothetical protein